MQRNPKIRAFVKDAAVVRAVLNDSANAAPGTTLVQTDWHLAGCRPGAKLKLRAVCRKGENVFRYELISHGESSKHTHAVTEVKAIMTCLKQSHGISWTVKKTREMWLWDRCAYVYLDTVQNLTGTGEVYLKLELLFANVSFSKDPSTMVDDIAKTLNIPNRNRTEHSYLKLTQLKAPRVLVHQTTT